MKGGGKIHFYSFQCFKDIVVYTDGEEVSGVDLDLKIGFPLC